MAAKNNFEVGRNDSNYYRGNARPQKNAVIFLAAIAVFIVVVGVWQVGARINRPFDYKTKTSGATEDASAEEEYNALLARSDTDLDSLSDYDEIFVYKTSPYMEDTDSDGINDSAEMNGGADPLCPQGKDCYTSTEMTTATESATSTATTASSVNLSSSSADETALSNVLSGVSDAATLRQLLLSSGVSAEDLNKISDEELMKSYQETLESQKENASE